MLKNVLKHEFHLPTLAKQQIHINLYFLLLSEKKKKKIRWCGNMNYTGTDEDMLSSWL